MVVGAVVTIGEAEGEEELVGTVTFGKEKRAEKSES